MARLGYGRYGAQGGDWGSIISTQVALVDPAHVAGLHLNMCFGGAPAGGDPNEGLTRGGARAAEGTTGLPGRGDRLSADSGHQAADDWHRVERFAGRPGGVDCREVPHVVRLRREPGHDIHERRAPDEHHALLGDADGGVLCPHLLRESSSVGARATPAGGNADGLRRFPQGDHLVAPPLARAQVQHHALDRDAARRTFRGDGATAAAGGRRPGVLPRPARVTVAAGHAVSQWLAKEPSGSAIPRSQPVKLASGIPKHSGNSPASSGSNKPSGDRRSLVGGRTRPPPTGWPRPRWPRTTRPCRRAVAAEDAARGSPFEVGRAECRQRADEGRHSGCLSQRMQPSSLGAGGTRSTVDRPHLAGLRERRALPGTAFHRPPVL